MIKTLRLSIGWLFILTPWLLSILLWKIPASISFTYYTNAGTCFCITLGSFGLLMCLYKWNNVLDRVIYMIVGICAIGMCLFPCKSYPTSLNDIIGTFNLPMWISNIVHITLSVLFFITLIVDCFRFIGSNKNVSKNKKIRNIIYWVCGFGMVFAFSIMPYTHNFWFSETMALTFLGIGWLTKSNSYKWLFKDKVECVNERIHKA